LEKSGKTLSQEEIDAIREPIIELYEKQASAYYSSARIWDDGIIDPRDTRTVVGLAIAAALNKNIEDPKFGIFRM